MKIRIKFSKQGAMKFIGHLDIMRYFQKAVRRADVDIRYSEGFSPHQIMSFAAPLGVGLTSNGEYVDIEVLSSGSSAEMVKRLNDVMVEGMKILSYRSLPDSAGNAMSLVAACDYTVRFRDGYDSGLGLSEEEFFRTFDRFLDEGNLEVVKKTKKGERQLDLRPYIYEHATILEETGSVGPDSKNTGLNEETSASARKDSAFVRKSAAFLKLAAGSSVNIKPELVLEAFYKDRNMEYPPFAFQITREEVYAEIPGNMDNGSHSFKSLEEFGENIE